MTACAKTLARCAAALALGAAFILPHAGFSHAAAPRPLGATDFYSLACCAAYVPGTDPAHPVPTIAGTHFDHGLLLGHSNFGNASATFNLARYPGYGSFTARAGIIDGSQTNIAERLSITGDGKLIYSHVFRQGELAVPISVPLGKAQAITLEADSAGDDNATGLLLADPILLPSGAATGRGTTPSAGAPGIQFLYATAAAGSQQTAQITTAAGASAVLVVDYATGAQTVLGPAPAGPGGKLTLSWTIPAGVSGTAHATLDSAGQVAQATFTVG